MRELERIHPKSRGEWRRWLESNCDRSAGVKVVQWRTATGKKRLSYDDLVEEALCFGWIDSRYDRLDDERATITMTPRRANSAWARSNKERVERLIADGRMTDAGIRAIEVAKANGSWTILDDVEALIVPDDLAAALAANDAAQRHFDAFPPSAKKQILFWIASAKRVDTRQRRVAETVRLAEEKIRAPGPSRTTAG